MRKILLALAIGLFSTGAWAAVPAPLDAQGHALATLDWVGALPCGLDSSTGTSAMLCGSVGRSVVYGVIASSIAMTDFLVFRDTNTANLTSSTVTVVFNTLVGQNIGSTTTFAPTTNFIKFTVPIRFSNGIGVNDNVTPTANGIARWTILYRPLAAGE